MKQSAPFRKNFLWGASTNAQQFEGGANKGGKGLSIADERFIIDAPSVNSFDQFSIASDHYSKYKEDIAFYSEMGFSIYRFSMAWSRIFPNGDDSEPNEQGLNFYDKVIMELEKYKIKPVVTLYAYDLPLALLKKYEGWKSRQCIHAYLNYVRTVVSRFKGRVKYWVPFNEQNLLTLDAKYITGSEAKNLDELFLLEHHFNLAYAQAIKQIHQIDPMAKAGCNIGNVCVYPKTCDPNDVEAADLFAKRIGYSFGDIYCRGRYPQHYLNNFKKEIIHNTIRDGDLSIISDVNPDFLSLTYYMSTAIGSADLNRRFDMETLKSLNPYVKQTEWGWNIDPYGFKHCLEDFYHRYQKPILVLENGLGHRDQMVNGKVNDDYRINYLAGHIQAMKEAEYDGVQIIGYLVWSATDLYSTREGFDKRYGFVYVDNKTQHRYRKNSFYWYQQVIASNGANLSWNVKHHQ